jgi:hypothetical protein
VITIATEAMRSRTDLTHRKRGRANARDERQQANGVDPIEVTREACGRAMEARRRDFRRGGVRLCGALVAQSQAKRQTWFEVKNGPQFGLKWEYSRGLAGYVW